MSRHDTPDLLALLAGLLFAGLGLAFLADAAGWVDVEVDWVPPVVLIVLGAGALLSGFRRTDDDRP